MELRRVKHFLAVVDQGSFTAAAQKLGVSQQAVSKSINVLEDELGVRLFERDTRLVTLSRFGELLLSHARNIDAEAQQFKRHLEDAVGVRSGRLVIGAGLTATTYILPLVLRRRKFFMRAGFVRIFPEADRNDLSRHVRLKPRAQFVIHARAIAVACL